jgi:acyl-CoA thioesterase FadM
MTMPDGFTETYRTGVGAWECDAFGHLNIAFYGERFCDAGLELVARVWPDTRWFMKALDIRYQRELRAGEVMGIGSAIIGSERDGIRLAHRATNAAGECTTLAEQVLVPDGGGTASAMSPAIAASWERFAPADLPASEGRLVACRNRVRPREAEEGRLALEACLHRFSDACLSVIETIGMSDAWRRSNDRGFATVETRLLVADESAAPGSSVVVTSGVIAVGASSLRMLHRLRDGRDGRFLAHFYQAGVNFDLAARRAAPWPQEFRSKADSLRISDA